METNSFTAVDFETATSSQMICQVGIVVVKDNIIIDTFESYVKPPMNKYDIGNINVHHISAETTMNAPTFSDLWPKIEHYFINTIVVAHNSNFDESVLYKNLDYYGIMTMGINSFHCTCSYYNRSKLECLCAGFNMKYNPELHHSALYDAKCCAEFAIHMFNGDSPDWSKVEEAYSKKVIIKKAPNFKNKTKLKGDIYVKDLTGADETNPFYDRKIVITGEFNQERKSLAKTLKSMGADIDSAISKKTNYVLIGTNPGPVKIEKLDKLIHDGYNIRKLHQSDLDKIFSGIYDDYQSEKIIKKELDLTITHYKSHHITFKDGLNIIASKDLYFGKGLSGNPELFYQITGNLGAFGDKDIYPETKICILSDYTLMLLEKGVKDETVIYIQDYYNNNKSIIFDFYFMSESDILDYCKKRCDSCGDELTVNLHENYMESAIKTIDKKQIEFKEDHNYIKINGMYILKMNDGRTWCPSRQIRDRR